MKATPLRLLVAALVTGAMLSATVSADLERSKTYTDGMFSDVPASEWYAASVKDAYEYGIMQGDSATTFGPEGTLTVAEGITIASRIYESRTGTAIPDVSGGEWYTKYVDYAIANGIMTEGQFLNFDREIKRFEMATLLADVCPDLPEMNTVESLPDVAPGAAYADKVVKLYRAGILTGNDGFGTFAPASNLLRAEISAMAVRLVDSTQRVSKNFDTPAPRAYSDAFAIIEAVMENGRNGIANGWNYDNRFDLYNDTGVDKTVITDTSDEKFGSLIRDFKPQSDGVLRFEAIVEAYGNDNGVYIAFENENEDKLFQLVTKNGKWAMVGASETVTPIEVPEKGATTRFAIEMDIDLDNHIATAVINNTPCGSIAIPEGTLTRLVLGTNKVGTGMMNMHYVRLFKNYAVNDHFLIGPNSNLGAAPAAWDVTGDFKLEKIESMRGYDLTSVKADSKAGTTSTAVKTFTPVSGKISFETMILLPEKTDGATVSLMNGDKEAVKFETKDGKLYVGDTMVNDYIANVWQTLHIEADTAAATADIIVNGKKKATVALTDTSFDGIKIGFAPNKDAVMWFDDVELYNVIDHDDYPSYPQVAESKDYNIGMNVCWLWRDQQSGEGWDATSPFPEFDPYLGFYDEGLRETADWELKWIAEHGIDFVHACWYCPLGNIQAPIKEMRHSYAALHDGYMMAKYSDLVDFCIMWENNGQDCTSFEQFREYIWNYWVEYYFSDPRYARLDNKAVLTVWNRSNFEKAFGGVEGTKQAVEFMNEEVKKLGYDGIIILASTQGAETEGAYSSLAALGYDATYGYHWGAQGYHADLQISNNHKNVASAKDILHHIPTVSIGFNDVGRNESRDPIITKDDHLKVCQDIKEQLSTFNTGTWKDNTLFVSTWNEYSEGTYVFPTASNGFDYLENIRLTFTDDTTDHSALDVKPTDAQIDRVTNLYPPHHAPIRWFQFEKSDIGGNEINDTDALVPVRTYDMSNTADASVWQPLHNLTSFGVKDGVLAGTGTSNDFGFISRNMEPFAAADAPIVHIRMKNEVAAQFEIFFGTDKDVTLDQKKSKITAISKAGEFVDYYVNMETTGNWTGNIVQVRIDPQTSPGNFEIALIEFMGYPKEDVANTPEIRANTIKMGFTFKIKELPDGDYEAVGEAKGKGFYSLLGLYHEWDRFTGDGVLTLKTRDEKTYVFTVGSDKVIADGVEKPLGFTFTLRDGLPVFQMKKFCDALGFKYTMEGKALMIQSVSDEEYEMFKNRKENEWEFETFGELEGWRNQNAALSVEDGKLVVAPTNGDPAVIHTVAFDALTYSKIVIGVEYNDALAGATPQLFFTTSNSKNYSADKCINTKYDVEGKKSGDIVEITFNLRSSSNFSGIITGLRFDPLGNTTVVKIDYIRCIKPADDEDSIESESTKLLAVDDENQWYFDTDNELDGWRGQNADATVSGGYLKGVAKNGDPSIVRNVSFDASEYQVAVIGVRYKPTLRTNKADFFFITQDSPNWAADKGIKGEYQIPAFTNEGDTVEVRFDLSQHRLWNGTVTAIRFDPFGYADTFDIDYVRLYKIEGFVPGEYVAPEAPKAETATKPTSVTITNAGELPEGVTVTSESTGEIRIVDDPLNAGKKVYEAHCTKSGEQYNYLNVNMQFEAGKTYQISYKIMPLQTALGKDFKNTIIGGNFRFSTTAEPNVKDHTFAVESNKSTSDQWITVNAEYTVPEDYTATDKDCFQFWGKPIDGAGVNYLVSDISIELK